jgi:hypothetical protein
MIWDTLGYIAGRILLLVIVYLALMLGILYAMSRGEKETPARLNEYVQEYDLRTFRL